MATLKEQFLGNAAGCAEISPMSEFAEGSFTSYWNFPAVLCCYLFRLRSGAVRGIGMAAGEPIPFRRGVADGRGHACN